jgi:hypothetical protein
LISAVAKLESRMDRKWRHLLWFYLPGALLTAVDLVQTAYSSGGFQRQHSMVDLLVLAALYSAATLLWPVLFVTVALQYFGALPAIMTLGGP